MISKSVLAGIAAGVIVLGVNIFAGRLLWRILLARTLIATFGVGFAVGVAIKATNILMEATKSKGRDRMAATNQKIEPEIGMGGETERLSPAPEEASESGEEHLEEGEAPDFQKDTPAGEQESESELESQDAAKIADLISGNMGEE
jgi:hypothetical protein